ncbi:hypothetical protein [Stutzerimonas degradans]|uniref:hypothetical protein n=1 Tax=Stutzerimonas degradans TaxID=2968968 RepID=UPI00141ED331|nr:hypothetical protein [Stutzerimonas degradans]NHW01943.1 hypothetical protein [Stutzerimonas degradans]
MIEAMEVLLQAWGREVVDPALDVAIGSPLGRLGDDAPGGVGGHRCLSLVECAVAISRASQAVTMALDGLAKDAPLGLGSRGRVLQRLAHVRYCQGPQAVAVATQCARLGISMRTYRTQVDELHAELMAEWPVALARLQAAERGTDAHAAAVKRARVARDAARTALAAERRREVERKAAARAVKAAAKGAA